MKEIGLPEHGVGNKRRNYGQRPPNFAGRNQLFNGQQINRNRPGLPTGIPRLFNPQTNASNRMNPPVVLKQNVPSSPNSKIPIAKASPGQVHLNGEASSTNGNKSPMLPPAAVYLIEAKDAPRVVLFAASAFTTRRHANDITARCVATAEHASSVFGKSVSSVAVGRKGNSLRIFSAFFLCENEGKHERKGGDSRRLPSVSSKRNEHNRSNKARHGHAIVAVFVERR